MFRTVIAQAIQRGIVLLQREQVLLQGDEVQILLENLQ